MQQTEGRVMGQLDRFADVAEGDEGQPSEHSCANGWEDEENARPCRVCRPWHFACTTCGAGVSACHRLTGRCCPACPHTPPKLGRRKAGDQVA